MPLRTQRCNDIIRTYKDECDKMEKRFNDNSSQSHTSFLAKLLAMSKQDIQLSEEVIKAYKILMNHVRKCSSGRMQYLAECLLPGEADIGHTIEMEKTREIYLEMQKSFSRMEEKLNESEESSRIDELIESKVNEEEETKETKTNMYDWLDEEPVAEEEVTSGELAEQGELNTERPERVSRQNMRRQHRENIRKLREQLLESHESKLLEIRNNLTRFGTYFTDNMEEKIVGKKGEEISLISFRHLDGLKFTLDQMKNTILFSKLHGEMFCNFITMTSLIKSQESLSGVTTADCINTLKRISTRNYLAEILRCPSSTFTIIHILLTDPKDHVLDNLDHLARTDPLLFSMLTEVKGSYIPINEEKNITIETKPLFQLARLKPDKFQFIAGSVSKAIRKRMENTNSHLSFSEFKKVYNISSQAAQRVIKSGGSRAEITIPIDTPNQAHICIEMNESGITHYTILPCNLKGDGDTIQMHSRYRSTIEASASIYITGISLTGVTALAVPQRVMSYLYRNNNLVYTRSQISVWKETHHFGDFRFEYV